METRGRRLPNRRSLRLRTYDYASGGTYFVTTCVAGRRECLGEVVAGDTRLWMEGQIVQEVWDGIEERFATVATDAFVVMPNHVHGIVVLNGSMTMNTSTGHVSPDPAVDSGAGAMNRAPTVGSAIPRRDSTAAPTLGKVVRVFKAVSTHRIREVGEASFGWQRNYYERVIRNDRELERARAYVEGNPARWAEDVENPRVRG